MLLDAKIRKRFTEKDGKYLIKTTKPDILTTPGFFKAGLFQIWAFSKLGYIEKLHSQFKISVS
jgi:hypothetical protein